MRRHLNVSSFFLALLPKSRYLCIQSFPITGIIMNGALCPNIYIMNFSELDIPKVLFVTGIGTDVGKSYVAGWLAREIIASGKSCITQKMIQTGNVGFSEDIERHRRIMGTGYFDVDLAHITAPVILSYPASPHLAAAIDNKKINLHKITTATQTLASLFDHVILEGAGGLMVPIEDDHLTANYVSRQKLPVVVAVTGQLGSINHALLTFNALRSFGIPLFAAVYNPHFDKDETICADTRKYLKKWLKKHFPEALWIEMPEINIDSENLADLPNPQVSNMQDPETDTKPASLPPALTNISISKEQLSKLPPAHFDGDICVIQNEEQIADAIAKLRENKIIGFDTETRPSFKKGYSNTVSLIQLSTRDTCYLFRINKTGLTQPIIDLIEDPEILKIGLSTHDDFHNLNKIAKIEPQGFIDLQSYVKQFKIADNSLSRIYGIVFGQRISKGQRLTNWEADELTLPQQSYAALDAIACIKLYDYLSSGKFNPETSPYLASAFQLEA